MWNIVDTFVSIIEWCGRSSWSLRCVPLPLSLLLRVLEKVCWLREAQRKQRKMRGGNYIPQRNVLMSETLYPFYILHIFFFIKQTVFPLWQLIRAIGSWALNDSARNLQRRTTLSVVQSLNSVVLRATHTLVLMS